jgi:uncharacterized membrane-anchored protein
MRKLHAARMVAVVAMATLALACAARTAPSESESRRVWDDVAQAAKKGPIDVPLLDEAVLHVPAGEVFVPQPQADRLLDLLGDPGSHSEVSGLILPRDPRASWVLPVRFHKVGYVRDDDVRTWDADGLLQGLKQSIEEQNAVREKAAMPALTVVGWSEAPIYDSAHQRLAWAVTTRAISAKPDDAARVEYNLIALGRDGYFRMDLTMALAELPALKPVVQQQLAALEFNPGKRYADFDARTDRPSALGLAALVVDVAAQNAARRSPAWLAAPVAALLALLVGVLAWRSRRRSARRATAPASASVATIAKSPSKSPPGA